MLCTKFNESYRAKTGEGESTGGGGGGKGATQIASPAGARPEFEQASQVCQGNIRDLTGIATGFDPCPSGPAWTACSSLYHGLILG